MSDTAPFASVIVVCWNSEDVLGRCLERLLAQDYSNYEIVVVDDGSNDDTLEVAERALGSGKVTVISSPLNRGCPHARNLGLLHAKGEIIAFIDADGFAAPGWLQSIVRAFGSDQSIGGVASTVFLASNPLVINGAGGIVNRQGWGADLLMNESYERAELTSEVLYPMGCGMAVRRSAVDRVGPFDDRMLNYYDDVDYGVRLWRSGYRVVVAPDAWIDHGFGHSTRGDSTQKMLLCEQHRMRVAFKHFSLYRLGRWAAHEMLSTARATSPRHELKLEALKWNVRHLPSTLASRWRLRDAPRVPDRLTDPSWGEGFPVGTPPIARPRPERAADRVEMASRRVKDQLLYGWFPAEHVAGRTYRWAGLQAAALVELTKQVSLLRLRYAHVPDDLGGIEVAIREVGSAEPLRPVWSTVLKWQYLEQSVENHPVTMPAGSYEVVFSAERAWMNPPLDRRALTFALSSLTFGDIVDISPGGIDMDSAAVDSQLVRGWFEPESGEGRSYRWGGCEAAAIVRLDQSANFMAICHRFAPVPVGGLKIRLRNVNAVQSTTEAYIPWTEGGLHVTHVPVELEAGDYVMEFETGWTWTNPGQRDPTLPPDNRSLGFALASVSFAEKRSEQ